MHFRKLQPILFAGLSVLYIAACGDNKNDKPITTQQQPQTKEQASDQAQRYLDNANARVTQFRKDFDNEKSDAIRAVMEKQKASLQDKLSKLSDAVNKVKTADKTNFSAPSAAATVAYNDINADLNAYDLKKSTLDRNKDADNAFAKKIVDYKAKAIPEAKNADGSKNEEATTKAEETRNKAVENLEAHKKQFVKDLGRLQLAEFQNVSKVVNQVNADTSSINRGLQYGDSRINAETEVEHQIKSVNAHISSFNKQLKSENTDTQNKAKAKLAQLEPLKAKIQDLQTKLYNATNDKDFEAIKAQLQQLFDQEATISK